MKNRKSGILLAIFLAALIVRIYGAVYLSEHPSLHWDAAHYTVLARNLAADNGFVNEPGHPTAYRTPLYPFMVSLIFRVFGERYTIVYLLHALLGALTCAGIAWAAGRIAGIRAMIITGLLCALNPESVTMTGLLLTETTFSFLLAAGILALAYCLPGLSSRDRSPLYYLMAGIFLGLAILCRPNAMLWALLIGGYLLITRKLTFPSRILRTSLLMAGVVILVGPWVIRNWSVMGAPTLATVGGRTFWEFRHNDIPWDYGQTVTPPEFEAANERAKPRELAEYGGDPAQMVPIYNLEPRFHAYFYDQETIDLFDGLNEAAADREFYKLGIDYTIRHPLQTLWESMKDAVRVFSPAERGGGVNILMFLSLPFVILGYHVMLKKDRRLAVASLTALASLIIASFLVLYEPRYRFPFEPIFFLAGGLGLDRFLKGSKGDIGGRIMIAAGLLLMGIACILTLQGPVTS